MSKRSFEQMDYEWAPSQWQRPFTQDRWTLLLVQAARDGNLEHVKAAFSNGADINGIAHLSQDDKDNFKFYEMEGQTALHLAANSRNAKVIVQFLLDHGSDIYKKSERSGGRRPELAIFSHIFHGNKESVELLLNKAEELKLRSTPLLEERSWIHDHTPLLASLCGLYEKPDVVQLLLERKADINAHSSLGESALILCVKSAHSQSLERLLKWPLFPFDMFDFRNKEGDTALHLAALYRIDLSSARDLNVEDLKKYTRLDCFKRPSEFPEAKFAEHFAGEITDIITLLLEAGADVTAQNFKGESPQVSVYKTRTSIEYQPRFYGNFECLNPPYLIAAKIKLFDKIIEILKKWETLLVSKQFRMSALQENLGDFPVPLRELISDYDIYPPAASLINKLSLFKTKQTQSLQPSPSKEFIFR